MLQGFTLTVILICLGLISLRLFTNPSSKKRILLVYVHGFASDDATFLQFPDVVVRELNAQRGAQYSFRYAVYPTYKTAGDLGVRVDEFVIALPKLVRETFPRGHADVWLCGHSMGGLLCTDYLRRSREQAQPRWNTRITLKGLLFYDSPLLGLSSQALQLGSIVPGCTASASSSDSISSELLSHDTACTDGSKRNVLISLGLPQSMKWALENGTAIYDAIQTVRDAVGNGQVIPEYGRYALHCAHADDIKNRMESLDRLIKSQTIVFKNFYTELSDSKDTFCILPDSEPQASLWVPAVSSTQNTVQAHVSMFAPPVHARGNIGFDGMMKDTVDTIARRYCLT